MGLLGVTIIELEKLIKRLLHIFFYLYLQFCDLIILK